jgi:hypothetical protein
VSAPAREADARTAQATYVYGVTRRGAVAVDTAGVAGGRVFELAHRDLAAVVGHVPSAHVQAKRRDLLAHAEVLQQVFSGETVLPLRFGTVLAADEAVVDEFLKPRHDSLVRLLGRLDGLVELTLRAQYDEQAVLREIVSENARVARLKERGTDVELGAAVAAALEAKRASEADGFLRALAPLARDTSRGELHSEYELLRAAFLVERSQLPAFDAAVDALARSRAGVVVCKYVGPLPPHSFADLEGA